MSEPIRKIENIRDLLAVGIAPELAKFMLDQQRRFNYPQPLQPGQTVVMMQEIVCFVLDSMTPRAAEDLAKLKNRRVN
jgi:hypothetical protein